MRYSVGKSWNRPQFIYSCSIYRMTQNRTNGKRGSVGAVCPPPIHYPLAITFGRVSGIILQAQKFLLFIISYGNINTVVIKENSNTITIAIARARKSIDESIET